MNGFESAVRRACAIIKLLAPVDKQVVPVPFSRLQLFSRRKGEITNIDEWRIKREAVNSGWVPGKSAWETANAWVGSGNPSVPDDIQSLMDSHESTRKLALVRGEVEMKTHLHHQPPSGPRNHDVGLWASGDSAFVGIESKADDGFAETMRNQYEIAECKRLAGKSTRLHLRADWLSQCLLGVKLLQPDGSPGPGFDSEIGRAVLRTPYQLFAGVAGTLLEAKGRSASAAIFIVHQFRTRYTDDSKIAADAEWLDSFVSLLMLQNPTKIMGTAQNFKLEWGRMTGPIYIAERTCGESRWDMPNTIPVFIGKALTTRPF